MQQNRNRNLLPGELRLDLLYCEPDHDPVRMASFIGTALTLALRPLVAEFHKLVARPGLKVLDGTTETREFILVNGVTYPRSQVEAALLEQFLLAIVPELRPASDIPPAISVAGSLIN